MDNESLQRIIAAAIVGELSPEVRESLITSAVTALLSEKPGGRYDSPTTLQAALRDATQKVATDIVEEELRKPENVVKLQGGDGRRRKGHRHRCR